MKTILLFVLGFLIFTTTLVVHDQVVKADEEMQSVGEDDHGGPFKKFFRKLKPRKRTEFSV